MQQCTRCLHSNTDTDANFCSKCGSALGVQAASVEVHIEGFLRGPGGLKSWHVGPELPQTLRIEAAPITAEGEGNVRKLLSARYQEAGKI